MNKKFDDLMYQAGLTADGCWFEFDNYDQMAIMKFAELIVQECIKIVEAEAAQYSEPTWAVELVNDILEQCGVTYE